MPPRTSSLPSAHPENAPVSSVGCSINIIDWISDQQHPFTPATSRSSGCAGSADRKRARSDGSEPVIGNKRVKWNCKLDFTQRTTRSEDQVEHALVRYNKPLLWDISTEPFGPPSDFYLNNSTASSQLTYQALRELNPEDTGSQGSDLTASMPSTNNDPSGAIGPSDPRFEVELQLRGARLADFLDDIEPPNNLDEFKKVLAENRASPGPDTNAIKVFRQLLSQAASEAGVTQSCLERALPCIEEALLAQDQETVTDKQWSRTILLEPDRSPPLSACKPDQTFGWSLDAFPFRFDRVTQALKSFLRPVATYPLLHWAYFTVEAKGAKKTLREARLQNLHNGAVMLNNMLCIKQALGKEAVEAFLNQIHVASLELTTETIQISGYWASSAADGSVKFYGITVGCWTPNDPEGKQFGQARKAALNAIAWMRKETHASVSKDMQAYEMKLARQEAERLEAQTRYSQQRAALTPPSSQSGRPVQAEKSSKRLRSIGNLGNPPQSKLTRSSQSTASTDFVHLDDHEPVSSDETTALAENLQNKPGAYSSPPT